MACAICGGEKSTRLGVCWDCATAESIIEDGTDMYENGPDGSSKSAVTAMDKVKFLINKNWKPQS